ncbi:MAG: FtsW/RodA/SpoVE family cell cycle protein [Butyrivibrio sp.]
MLKHFNFKIKYYNWRLLIWVFALSAIGVLVIGSAVPGAGYQSKQILGLAGSLVFMFILSIINYNSLLKLHWLVYAACIGLLGIVLLFGKEVNGATRWFRITDSISVQPSEFAKILMIVFWAWLFGHKPDFLHKWRNFFIACGLTAVPLLLIVSEPDLSTTILTTCLFIVSLFIAGISYKKVGIILAVVVPLAVGLLIYIQTPNQKLLKPYQLKRIMAFVNPDEYADDRYQQDNSVLAIGSGQLTGKGLYNDSTESVKNGNYIVEPQTDFIFAIIGEELGFAGSLTVLILIMFIVAECVICGSRAPNLSGRIICFGVASIFVFQTFINVGVATELLPNTGIPLPIVSYGLSSLVSVYAGIGLVLSVEISRKTALEDKNYEYRINRA